MVYPALPGTPSMPLIASQTLQQCLTSTVTALTQGVTERCVTDAGVTVGVTDVGVAHRCY